MLSDPCRGGCLEVDSIARRGNSTTRRSYDLYLTTLIVYQFDEDPWDPRQVESPRGDTLGDLLPLSRRDQTEGEFDELCLLRFVAKDRKSTRLNSSHVAISYAVFCL